MEHDIEIETIFQVDELTKKIKIIKPFSKFKTSELIELKSYTMLYCAYTTSPKFSSDWWCNILISSYLINTTTGESLKLIKAINIPYSPKRHYLKKIGESLNFILVFPQIPKHWNEFVFNENGDGLNNLSSITLKRNSTGIYSTDIF